MRKPWPWIAVAAVLLASVLAYGISANRPDPAPAPAPAPRTGTMGAPVTQEGIFEYTVVSLECGTTAVGDAVPKGKFCFVGITVRNVSEVARKPGIAFAKAYDARGTGHLADAVAQIRAERAGSSLLEELAPGARISARLIYDVPADTTITSVVLRALPSSAGITIALG